MSADALPAVSQASVANDGSQPLTVILAPWAREHLLRPGDAVTVEGRGPAGSQAELLIERTCDTVVAWGWPGSELRLLARDGRVLVDWTGRAAAPGAP